MRPRACRGGPRPTALPGSRAVSSVAGPPGIDGIVCLILVNMVVPADKFTDEYDTYHIGYDQALLPATRRAGLGGGAETKGSGRRSGRTRWSALGSDECPGRNCWRTAGG